MKLLTLLRTLPVFATLFFIQIGMTSAAGVGINTTRVIFNQGNQSVPVTLRNSTEKEEYLVQVYLTKTAKGTAQDQTLDVLPPMFYLASSQQRDVRLVEGAGASALPKDRESVFYFHARAIAASEKNAGQQNAAMKGEVKIALESVIKVFYRPKNLTLTVEQAQGSLTFEETANGIKVINPSPYYITLSSLSVGGKAVTLNPEMNNTMIAPFASMDYPTPVKKGKKVWAAINDLGGRSEYSQP
ncbi:fimbrial biogenesis chaperone [Providencia sp. wls1914]|uniref:fimbrial biogenesis chaperone n=1 Tax=Providencia sp. wls1914 TaxID=2675156 RepID=UPI0012B6183B|nr:molecular chaperone [Providencia sp. wls1914]MTC70175.1 fimbria/pilus periplasmic chaperone [Providencia sp. wls1914]